MDRRKQSNGLHPPTPYEAIRRYTQSAAYAAFEEGIKGTLKPDMMADLVVLSANPIEVAVDDIREIVVEMTIIDGKVRYNVNRAMRQRN